MRKAGLGLLFATSLALPGALGATPKSERLANDGHSKKGITFWVDCFDDAICPSRHIASPDGKSAIEILYRGRHGERYAYLRVITPGLPVRDLSMDDMGPKDLQGGPTAELLWAPNSSAFLVNGHLSSYWGFWVRLFSLADPKLRAQNPTEIADRDLAERLRPWCKLGKPDDQRTCRRIVTGRHFNMEALSWLPDASGIAVLARVPGTWDWGVIMGQSRGYEIGVLGKGFLRRMSAAKFKARWQESATFDIEIPRSQRQALKDLEAAERN